MSRLAILALILLLAVVLWWVTYRPSPAPPPAGVATPTQPAVSAPRPSPTTPPFRLAGVATEGTAAYAVLEDPHGVTALYRLGETISGLGRLAAIAPQEARIDTDTGSITLRLQPAPTKPPAATPTPSAVRSPTRPAPQPTPSPAGSVPGSPP